jgi:NADPH:quinone reductase-like Zn-dependent oxidoreductase
VPSKLTPNEVLVKVEAAALNPVYVLYGTKLIYFLKELIFELSHRSGYKILAVLPNFLAKRPLVPEHDFAGVIMDGNGTEFKSGDRVFGWIPMSKLLLIITASICLNSSNEN